MSYDKNQKSSWVQADAPDRRGLIKVSGLWVFKETSRGIDLKSGRINLQGWNNLQYHGENTILFILPNLYKKKGDSISPDYYLWAGKNKSERREEIYFDDIKEKE